jgi:hypothetical protein
MTEDRTSLDYHNMNPTGRGYRIPMPSGIYVYPEDPRPEEFNIYDVAHKLAFQCRYGGGCQYFYSVAEHSWNLSYLVPQTYALAALMHDRGEAWLQDFLRPVKKRRSPGMGSWSAVSRKSAPLYGVSSIRTLKSLCRRISVFASTRRKRSTPAGTRARTLSRMARALGSRSIAGGPTKHATCSLTVTLN